MRHSATLGIEVAALDASSEIENQWLLVGCGGGVDVAVDSIDIAGGVDVDGVVSLWAGLWRCASVDGWALE